MNSPNELGLVPEVDNELGLVPEVEQEPGVGIKPGVGMEVGPGVGLGVQLEPVVVEPVARVVAKIKNKTTRLKVASKMNAKQRYCD